MHRDHFRTHQAHTKNVRRLAFNVFGTHINTAFQAEQGAGKRRSHAMLTCTGFGNDFSFTHPLRQ